MEIIDNRENKICSLCYKTKPQSNKEGQLYLTQCTFEGVILESSKNELYVQRLYCDKCYRENIKLPVETSKDYLISGSKVPDKLKQNNDRIIDYRSKEQGYSFVKVIDVYEEITGKSIEYDILKNPLYLSVDCMLLYDDLLLNGIKITDYISQNGNEINIPDEAKKIYTQFSNIDTNQSPYYQSLKHYREKE